MARGYGGLTALRAALGAAGGGFEGYAKSQEMERQRRLQEEAAKRQTMMDTLALANAGAMPVMQREALGQQSKTAISNALNSLSGAAFGGTPTPINAEAIQRGMGAMGAPAATVDLGGTKYAIPTMQERQQFETAQDLRKLTAQQEFLDKRQADKEDRENRGYFEVLQKAKALPEGATFDMYRNTPLKATFDEYMKNKALTAALNRTNIMATATAGRGGYVQGVAPGTESPQFFFAPSGGGELKPTGIQVPEKDDKTGKGEMASGLQAMGVARANSALNLLESNAKQMENFEKSVLAGKANITALQMEAARFAMSGQKGSAIAEDRLAKGIPGLMDSNPALLRYVRSAKAIAGAVREITPRGGSNLMMQMETALSGIGPGGTDPESINQVTTFRNDLLTGVREGVNAMKGKSMTPGAATRPPLGAFIQR